MGTAAATIGKKGNKRIIGSLCAALGGMCWGLSGSMGQYLFRYQGMDSRWLVPYRLELAGLVLFLYCFFRHREKLFEVFRTAWGRRQILIYTFGVCLCQFLYFQTIQWSNAGIGTILQDLSPIFILLWGCITSKRSPKAREVLAIALALAGVLLITAHGHLSSGAVPLKALLTGIGSAICVTIYNEVPQEFLDEYPVSVLQTWAFAIGGGAFFLVFRPWTFSYVPNATGLFGIAFVVLVGNVLAFTVYMTGVSMIGPGMAILYGFTEPVTAAAVTFLAFGSKFTFFDGLGFLSVFLMLALISAGKAV